MPFLKKSGVKTSIVVLGLSFFTSCMTLEKWLAPPSSRSSLSTDVITTCFRLSSLVAKAILFGSRGSKKVGLPVLTDVHTAEQCSIVADHVDVLQIPAFLCRQTDLLIAAAKTGKIINVKKGQFLAPWDMANVIKKIEDSGNKNILITERGASFGYNTLVSDMRALPIMSKFGFPIVFDATHSVQQPGGMGEKSGGQREFVPYLARAAIAVGVGAIFMETHEDPDNAPSDGPNMVPIKEVKSLLKKLTEIDKLVK